MDAIVRRKFAAAIALPALLLPAAFAFAAPDGAASNGTGSRWLRPAGNLPIGRGR